MLESHLQYHKDKLVGIVNGIDVNQWDPANDNLIAAKYSTKNAIEGKDANKLALQKELGLDEGKDKFIVGLISRLTNQKGLDLVSAVVDDFVDDNTQFVVLGTGDAEYEEDFREAEKKYPGKVSAQIMYDEALSHKIYAAVDVLLVPSKFEPCGLTQLIAMRYGTAPVVRETGGLKDTVEPFDAKADTGNGFTFVDYDAEKLLGAITDAKDLFNDDRAAWDRMVVRNMEKDVSWTASAQKYDEYYKQLLGK
jgi:starch synthase